MNYIYITGTGSGIGEALAMELLKSSSNKVIGISRNNSISHPNFSFNCVDLSKLEIVERMKFKPLTNPEKIVLVNNAGILGDINFYGKLTSQHIQQVYNVNLIAPSLLINNFIEKYSSTECEKIIINISSGAAQSPYEAWGTYCASKAGLEMLSKVLVKEDVILNQQVKVFSIAPGVVDTNMQSQIRSTSKENFPHQDKFIELKNGGKLFDPKDVAKKIASVIHHPEIEQESVFRIVL